MHSMDVLHAIAAQKHGYGVMVGNGLQPENQFVVCAVADEIDAGLITAAGWLDEPYAIATVQEGRSVRRMSGRG